MSQSPVPPPRGPLRLHRSSHGRMIGGVCAGLAESFGAPAWIFRVIFVLGNFLPGPGLLVYLVLWALLPLDRT